MLFLFCAAAFAQTPAKSWDTYSDTWVGNYVGTDGQHHPLPMYEDVGPPKANKTVGIFYFLWVDGRTGVVNDNAKVLAQDPEHVFAYTPGAWHWWGEPLFGYYLITDPFVLRKHAQMLTDAGVDTLLFDSTNAYLHEDQYNALCTVYEDIRKRGQTTPQFAHVTNAQSGKTVQKIYDEFYAKNLYPDLWFKWLGKPLILAKPDELTPALKDFFTVRRSWAFNDGGWFGTGQDRWPWIDNYPQEFGWHTDPKVAEELPVCVAQHAHMTIGRSYHGSPAKGGGGFEPPPAERTPERGLYFAEQWDRAFQVNPDFVYVTGWNEWIAPAGQSPGRNFLGHVLKSGQSFFVDEYSPEFSRDAEPSLTVNADNNYYQLVNYTRRYKGVRPLASVTPAPIALNGNFSAWAKVGPEFRDDIGDPVYRDFPGFAKGSHFSNATGRNDIVAAKVSYDKANVYFYVRTRDKLTPHTEKDWMLLYLNTDGDYKTGWLGYDYVVNRQVGAKTTTLEKNVGGQYAWDTSTAIKYQAGGNELVVAVPRKLLGATPLTAIDFKWADNCYAKGDWTDFTLNGDAAPNDRFNYHAKFEGK